MSLFHRWLAGVHAFRRRWSRRDRAKARAASHLSRRRSMLASRLPTFERCENRDLMAGMTIGMNLENIVDWSPAWTFTDAFQSSRPWISHDYEVATGRTNWQGSQPVAVDDDGEVTSLASWTDGQGRVIEQRVGTVMFRDLNGAYPAGVYRAEWEGTGTVNFGFDALVIERGVTEEGRQFANLNVVPSQAGIYLRIDATDPADPVRDIHVWLPDYQGQSFAGQRWTPGADFSPFHPLFKERLDDFGILRFMQAQETNTTDIESWGDRRDTLDARQSSGNSGALVNGMAVEYMVQLANELDADPWFNMPHGADDEFVQNFATYVRDHLEPELTAYVEWSNEVWNTAPGYEAHTWLTDQTGLLENSGLTRWQVAGQEAARDLNLWSEVFVGQESRLVRVAGGFASNPWVTERVVENMGGSFDAIAIAPYFGPTPAQRATYSAATTVDQVLGDLSDNIYGSTALTLAHQRIADEYSGTLRRDIKLLAYEGGQHLNALGAPYQGAFFAASQDPRMADLTRDYLRQQNAAGLDAYVHYRYTQRDAASPFGNFGVLTRQDESLADAPVYEVLMEAATGELFAQVQNLVTVSPADARGSEIGQDLAFFRFTRGGDLSQPLLVRYAIGGSATPGVDYTQLPGTVWFPAGQNTAYVAVRPIDDPTLEGDESVTVTLLGGAAYQLVGGSTASASVGIVSDDRFAFAPTVSVVATDPIALENGQDPGVFTFTRSQGDLNRPLTVWFQIGQQTAGADDIAPLPRRVDFAPGQTTARVIITPQDDAVVENRESVTIVINNDNPNYRLGERSATVRILDNDGATPHVLPVLIVISNNDFYYQEYADPRAELEAAGIPVIVAAGRRELSTPHQVSGQGADGGRVMPDISLDDVVSSNYSAILFVGGWGASQYQYAFEGTYFNPTYNSSNAIRARVNQLVNEFESQDKYVTAICHGVSILAWARVDGVSPVAGKQVSTAHFNSPASTNPLARLYRWHSEVNGATVYTGGAVGDPTTRDDDVIVDGRIVTAENFDSARLFGRTIAGLLQSGG